MSENPTENNLLLEEDTTGVTKAMQWFGVLFLVYILIMAVGMIGTGFKAQTAGRASELFEFATNPFTGLVIGILGTSLIQSSSTVTSIIVGLVAGGLPVETAIPMVMGANMGTTITNTIVAMGHLSKKKTFRRAFAAATVHDFFNLMAVFIFLPIEIMFGVLEKIGGMMAGVFVGADASVKDANFIKPITKPVIGVFQDLSAFLYAPLANIILIILGVVLIFVSITVVGKLLRRLLVGTAKEIMHRAIGRGPLSGILSGAVVTVLVQSSSTTTSLMVPLAGTGKFRLKQIYPFTLGANIGTTITGLLAATAATGANAIFAMQIALVHLSFNVLAVVVIFGIPFLRHIPLAGANRLAKVSAENKLIALGYVLGVYFGIPFMLIWMFGLLG